MKYPVVLVQYFAHMQRDFELGPRDRIGVRTFANSDFLLLRIAGRIEMPDGEPGFVLQGAGLEVMFAVHEAMVQSGGLYKRKGEDVVWEFPDASEHWAFTNEATRRASEGKFKRMLRKFNPKRFAAQLRGVV